MTNIVIQQIKITYYKNIFLMPITSNYRLIIILALRLEFVIAYQTSGD